MNGWIKVDSKLHQGATFTFNIPLHDMRESNSYDSFNDKIDTDRIS